MIQNEGSNVFVEFVVTPIGHDHLSIHNGHGHNGHMQSTVRKKSLENSHIPA